MDVFIMFVNLDLMHMSDIFRRWWTLSFYTHIIIVISMVSQNIMIQYSQQEWRLKKAEVGGNIGAILTHSKIAFERENVENEMENWWSDSVTESEREKEREEEKENGDT